jgi:hypothetical protein
MTVTNRLPARFTLAHGLMVLSGLLTFILVSSALADKRETVTVFLATEAAAAGQPMTPRPAEIAKDTPGIELYATRQQLEGLVLARSLPAGQPIMRSDLVNRGEVQFRTVAIQVDDYQIRGLGLDRNDRVDVVGFDEDDMPLYLATNLVVEETSARNNDGLGGVRAGFVALQVDDVEALRLSQGQLNGPLWLVRSTGAAPITVVSGPPADGMSLEAAGGEQP